MKKILISLVSSLCLMIPTDTRSQMSSVVNSLADDEFSHPHDKAATHEIDESMDGICEDSLGRCTLRAALEEASYLKMAAYVTFLGSLSGNIVVNDLNGAFGPPDNSIIQGVRQKVIIYGSNFSTSILFGVQNNTAITGLGFANGLIGILVAGDNNLIGANLDPLYSNYFHHFSQNGILVTGNSNSIIGNRIGIAFDGTPIGSPFGIFITGAENLIGGTGQGEGNIISGNDKGIGVYTLSGSTYIYGNKIGTDSAGTQAVGNRVGIDNIGPNVHIGNNTSAGKNVISGNTESGILIGTMAENNFIRGNHIGTDVSGTIPVPNRDGITLGPGSFHTLVEHNLISNNTQNGILLSGIPDPQLESDFHIIAGNEILSNGNVGIAVSGASHYNTIGSSLTDVFDPNQIKFNGVAGVVIVNAFADPQQNTIRRNSFQDNTSLGIQIVAGQGNIQPPVLMTFTDNGQGMNTITGSHSLAGAVIDIYTGDANASDEYEGLQWLGEGLTDAGGNFSITLPTCSCDTIVATATDILGNTSEFSAGAGVITSSADRFALKKVIISPTPFNENVNITFELLQPGEISLEIYNLNGRKTETLIQGTLSQGEHRISWNPDSNPSGIYYYRLTIGNQYATSGKIVYVQ